MTWSVHPDPRDETERQALLAAVEQALAEEQRDAPSYAGPWWRAGFEEPGGFLGGGPAAEQPWREPGVVEP
jgi:hypothetical protein